MKKFIPCLFSCCHQFASFSVLFHVADLQYQACDKKAKFELKLFSSFEDSPKESFTLLI